MQNLARSLVAGQPGLKTWTVLAAVSSIVLVYLRFGYHDVLPDHFILDLKGLAAADPTAFVNDWFTHQVPQPHWLYDRWVAFFSHYNALSLVKGLSWLVACALLGLSFFLITEKLAQPGQGFWALLLTVWGPLVILGSTNTAMGGPLPHFWGASLFLFTFALVVRKSPWAIAGVMLTPLAHAQLGCHLAILFIAVAGMKLATKQLKDGSFLLLIGLLALAGSLWIVKQGSVFHLDVSYDRLCERYHYFHCFSQKWPWTWWVPLAFVMPGTLFFIRLLDEKNLKEVA